MIEWIKSMPNVMSEPFYIGYPHLILHFTFVMVPWPVSIMLCFVWITLALMVISVVIDLVVDPKGFDPLWMMSAYHHIFIFPLILFMLVIRFKLQKRKEAVLYMIHPTLREEKWLERLGYITESKFYDVTYQNAFGAKFDGCDETTIIRKR